MLAMTSPLLLLHLLPLCLTIQSSAAALVVAGSGTSSTTSSSDQSGTRRNHSGNSTDMVARNSAIGSLLSEMTDEKRRELITVIVCDSFQRIIGRCTREKTFLQYLQTGTFPSLIGRSTNFGVFVDPWFNSGVKTYKPDQWQSTNHNYLPQKPPVQNPPQNTNTAFICPTFVNQSLIYQLSNDSSDYPVEDVSQELGLDLVLLDCLAREIVLETDPPQLVTEDFRMTANATCPFTQFRLWKYQSIANGGQCFVLQNYQEPVLYRVCSEQFCRNCTDKVPSKEESSYSSYSNDWKSSSNTGPNTLNQKLCIPDFRTVSIWAYCPTQPAGSRIVRDRIIVPSSCCCQSVRCTAVPL